MSEKDGKVPSLNGSLSSICAFDFYSGRSPNLSFSRNNVLADWLSKVPALACFSRSLLPPTYPLRPIKTNNARTLCIAAAAGTELGRCFLPQVVSLSHPAERVLQSSDWPSFISLTNRRWVRLSPIAQDSSLLPPQRSSGLVSVPMWLAVLPNQLRIIGLVSFYLTNYLNLQWPIPKRLIFSP